MSKVMGVIGEVVSFEPIKWALDLFKMFLTGRFIFLTIMYFGFVGISFYDGYKAHQALDQQYGLSQSQDYISISRGQCTAYYNIKNFHNPVKIVKGMPDADCTEVSNSDYASNTYNQHMLEVRGANDDGNFWIFPGVFFLFMCVMYINSKVTTLIYAPKRALFNYCVAWFVFAAMMYPATYGAYGSVSIFHDSTGQEISVSSGKITNDGRWMYQPQSFFGVLSHTKKYDSPRDM